MEKDRLMMSAPESIRQSASDYFARPETSTLEELIDGEIIVSPTPLVDHQILVLALAECIKASAQKGRVFIAPLSVQFDDENIPEPDVFWVAPESRCKRVGDRLEGPPDLVVEVLSPSSRARDKKAKFRLYERFGVAEYWIADPEAAILEAWTLRDGAYALAGVFDAADTFQSPVLGAAIALGPVFAALQF
jgi:Uma2 family endonuclease